jgi:hypothetical protein
MANPYGLDDTSLVARSDTPTRVIDDRGLACSPMVQLPESGVLMLPGGEVVTLASGATFQPACTPVDRPAIVGAAGGGMTTLENDNTTVTNSSGTVSTNDLRDPFFASTFPQCYALAATTMLAYTLFIMLLITPRSFINDGVVVLGRRRFTDGGASGHDIGGRPWLQKVAALSVAVSLTIASVNTFGWAENQYVIGKDDARQLQDDVMDSVELKTISIISDSFLWLAQAQTLTRLFPRQREKIIIKWTAFTLVGLDVIFQSLNSFGFNTVGGNRPQNFTQPISALNYLFQLTLGVLYAAWVIYYALLKRRFAFYHPNMKNIFLLALLALTSVLVPIVFFILDLAQPDFTFWGPYVRWVGAAAASTIVWEWVERIEALEREEKKDGILGREVFDGDEMMEITTTDLGFGRRKKRQRSSDDDGDDDNPGDIENRRSAINGQGTGRRAQLWPGVPNLASRIRSRQRPSQNRQAEENEGEAPENTATGLGLFQPPLWPARPGPAVTPVSRTDTTSADSTVYAVRYQPLTETSGISSPTPAAPGEQRPLSRSGSSGSTNPPGSPPLVASHAQVPALQGATSEEMSNRTTAVQQTPPSTTPGSGRRPSRSNSNPQNHPRIRTATPTHDDDEHGRWNLRGRLEDFAMNQAERMRERLRPTVDTSSLQVHVVPAPPRRGAALAQVLEEAAAEQETNGSAVRPRPHVSPRVDLGRPVNEEHHTSSQNS